MITGIAIENFKGIRERVEIELRPITLLFGANSAGKSSIFHALHYAREVFERHNLSPDLTTVGGNAVDLGGFCNFVHGQDKDLPIRLTFQVDCRDWSDFDYLVDSPYSCIADFLHLDGFDCFGICSQVGITVEIRWSEMLQRPYVAALHNQVDGSDFLVVTSDSAGRRVELKINAEHPTLTSIAALRSFSLGESKDGLEGTSEEQQSSLAACLNVFRECCQTTADGAFFLEKTTDALLDLSLPEIPFSRRTGEEVLHLQELLNGHPVFEFCLEVNEGIGRFLWPALRQIHSFLARLRHLGPLREVPSRTYVPPSFPDVSRWASGLGAWDRLASGDDKLVNDVSSWLGDEDRLNSGYRLRLKRFKELDLSDPLVIQLISGRAFDEVEEDARLNLNNLPTQSRLLIVTNNESVELRPNDVGIGLSQLVPVIVTALDGQNRLLAIEQPELHLHPKLQAELADLLITSAKGATGHTLILETHSELIPLRIMRRIRNSVDGHLPSHLPPVSAKDVAIYYVETHQGATVVRELELGEEGQLLDPWPEGFFEEGFRERFSS